MWAWCLVEWHVPSTPLSYTAAWWLVLLTMRFMSAVGSGHSSYGSTVDATKTYQDLGTCASGWAV